VIHNPKLPLVLLVVAIVWLVAAVWVYNNFSQFPPLGQWISVTALVAPWVIIGGIFATNRLPRNPRNSL
jgi:hypothetical protein